jgi:hypothetical protein
VAAQSSLIFNLVAKDKVSKVLADVKRKAADAASGMADRAKSGVAGLLVAGVGIAGLTTAIGDSISAATEYQTLAAKTSAVLKSTGGAAGTTGAHIRALAASLESMSATDEELIINSQNVLATFTKVRNETGKGNAIFDRATLAALNMSKAMGTDLKGTTVAFGKALNNPVKGVTALAKSGVTFTDAQKKQIAAMQKSGNLLGAQKIILAEVNKEFGGAAKAAGTGFAGSLFRLKDVAGDTQREFGQALLPTLTRLANWAAIALPQAITTGKAAWSALVAGFKGGQVSGAMAGMSSAGATLAATWKTLQAGAAWIQANRQVIEPLVVAVVAMAAAWKAYQIISSIVIGVQIAMTAAQAALNLALTANPIGLIVLALVGLAAGLIYAYKHSATFRTIVDGAMRGAAAGFQWLWGKAQGVFGWLKANWRLVLGILTGPIGLAVMKITENWGKIKDGGSKVLAWFKAMPGRVGKAFGGIGAMISAPWISGFNAIRGAWNSGPGRLHFTMPDWVPGMGGKSFSMPRLAQGGIVKARTGGTAVIVGEGGRDEAVVPLPRGGGGRGPGGGAMSVTFNFVGTDRKMVQLIKESIRVDFGGDPVKALSS